MVRAVYRNGKIEPLGGVPAEWEEGEELTIEMAERFLGPEELVPDIEQRLADFHAHGPMEFEPGEREEIERIWKEMDEVGRQETKRMLDQHP